MGFRVRASEPVHQDDWGKHREGPKKSLGARKLLGKVTKVIEVTKGTEVNTITMIFIGFPTILLGFMLPMTS